MESLTKKEEEIMQILWKLKKGFVKDVINEIKGEKPPYNTISSIVRILVKKGFVDFKQYGNTYEYFPKISKKKYRKHAFKGLMSKYFDGSYKKMVSYIVNEKKLDEKQIDEMMNFIKESDKKSKKK